ncbi:MAG: 3-deoxy-D-manno-octulosonic acid transferase, partial [Saprospiraceae bacterium]|nr:3-deoxy-D-manno-octulosonic acid transferase [Saprospiraceae bacterium]
MLYNLLIHFYAAILHLAAMFHPKARLWVEGRRNWRDRLRLAVAAWQGSPRVFWIHAASLGEFEQGRPVIEAFRAENPDWKIVLTFFSPSGYEIRKNYPHADLICYLPVDTTSNARDFLDILRPEMVVFVKYEFWSNIL